MQIDRPTANPSTPAVGVGLGQSLLTLRFQVHPRVTLDLTDTYFRDVPTYDPTLVGTGLLDKYLFQGLNGGARIQFPEHITGYFSLGRSSEFQRPQEFLEYACRSHSLPHLEDRPSGRCALLQIRQRLCRGNLSFDFAYQRPRRALAVESAGWKYAYNSSLATNSNSYFVNLLFDTNLGARYFMQSGFTTQRGGAQEYNQWTTTLGYRFDNRASSRRVAHANQP
jgi:hypothetical protein